MNALKPYFENLKNSQLALLAVVLCFPAFLLNLGSIAFIGDEAIRTLVAFEMKLSGNFIVPTLNGEEYYNKPPLYNWFIYILSLVFGYFGEWPTRITTLIFLGLFAATVYYFVHKSFDKLTAVTMALMLLTSGRILFWDSMLGLIDISFSWIIYLNFMILYTLAKAQRWRLLFIASYLLFSVAFLLKGLPAVVFQGISMVMTLWFYGEIKRKLFSVAHLAGIGIGLIPVLLYYTLYATQVSLDQVFSILLDQSLQRTATHHGVWKTLTHIFIFPFEQFYHFLPWSLLLGVIFHPRFKTWVQGNDFIRFHFWMLISNLPVYWLSVQVYPRYLLMFVPLFNLIGYYAIQQSTLIRPTWWKSLQYIFLVLTCVAALLVLLIPLDVRAGSISGITFIWITGSAALFACALCIWVDHRRMFLWFTITLLTLRILFDVVVLPIRKLDYAENICREDCKRTATLYSDHAWYIYKETQTQEVARFYTSAYTRQIIRRTQTAVDTSAYYLVDMGLYPDFPGRKMDSLILERGQVLGLMRPESHPSPAR